MYPSVATVAPYKDNLYTMMMEGHSLDENLFPELDQTPHCFSSGGNTGPNGHGLSPSHSLILSSVDETGSSHHQHHSQQMHDGQPNGTKSMPMFQGHQHFQHHHHQHEALKGVSPNFHSIQVKKNILHYVPCIPIQSRLNTARISIQIVYLSK